MNILSYHSLQQHYRITTDTALDPGIYVHIRDGVTLRFTPYKGAIYLLDPSDYHKLITTLNAYSCAAVVTKNNENFTRREVEGADRAQALYNKLRKPVYSTFIKGIAKK